MHWAGLRAIITAYSVEDIQRIIDERQQVHENQSPTIITDTSILKKLDEAAKSFLYENFSVQPLSGDYPADVMVDYQLDKVHGQNSDILTLTWTWKHIRAISDSRKQLEMSREKSKLV